jgi:hypothetical protein
MAEPKTRSSTPTEPSPESVVKKEETERAATEVLQRVLDKLHEGASAAAAASRKLEGELIRRRSTPAMPAVRPPLPPPHQGLPPRPVPPRPTKK